MSRMEDGLRQGQLTRSQIFKVTCVDNDNTKTSCEQCQISE